MSLHCHESTISAVATTNRKCEALPHHYPWLQPAFLSNRGVAWQPRCAEYIYVLFVGNSNDQNHRDIEKPAADGSHRMFNQEIHRRRITRPGPLRSKHAKRSKNLSFCRIESASTLRDEVNDDGEAED